MKLASLSALAFCVLSVLTIASPETLAAADAPQGSRPNIYDESLDGTKQVADALAVAKKENKRVLIQFGANWCGWCHKLHRLFNTDKEVNEELRAKYLLILVDVNNGHNEELVKKYGADRMGLPSLVVLDSSGKHLTTKDTGQLEEGDHHSPAKVMQFLKQWAPPLSAS